MKKYGIIAGIFIFNLMSLYLIFFYAPSEATLGEVYRIFFLHTPSAWVSYLAFGVTMFGSVMFLSRKKFKWDLLAEASAKIGVIFCSITILSGSIWAGIIWGSYWNWDPRETTTLILLMIYIAYLSFRVSVEERNKRAKLSSVLGILAFICVPLSYVSARLWYTLHPIVITTVKLGITGPMITTLMFSLIGLTLIYCILLKLTYDALQIEEKILKIKYENR